MKKNEIKVKFTMQDEYGPHFTRAGPFVSNSSHGRTESSRNTFHILSDYCRVLIDVIFYSP